MPILNLFASHKPAQKSKDPTALDRIIAAKEKFDQVVSELKLIDLTAQEKLDAVKVRSKNGEVSRDACDKT